MNAHSAALDVPAAQGSERRIELSLEGMTCAACAARIEKNLNRVPGVRATVNFATETASAMVEPSIVTTDDLITAVEHAGYKAHVRLDNEAERAEDRQHRTETYRTLRRELAIGIALTLAAARADGADARAGDWLGGARARRIAAALAAVRARDTGAILDRPSFLRRRVACAARRRRQHGRADRAGHDDGVGLERRRHAAGACASARLLRGRRRGDHAGAAGQAARGAREDRTRRPRSKDCCKLQPKTARVVRGGSIVEVPLAESLLGDRFVVRAGERIAGRWRSCAKANVERRREHADRREPARVAKTPGSTVFAGTLNQDGLIDCEATAVGARRCSPASCAWSRTRRDRRRRSSASPTASRASSFRSSSSSPR